MPGPSPLPKRPGSLEVEPTVLPPSALQIPLQDALYKNGTKKAFRNSLLRKALSNGRYWSRTSDLQLVELVVVIGTLLSPVASFSTSLFRKKPPQFHAFALPSCPGFFPYLNKPLFQGILLGGVA